jgi:nucleosome assembly protein 1-like 1
MDYEVGEIIKEKIIPRAVDWFTGLALQDEDMDEYEDEEYEDEDDEEEDGDDENQENEGKVQGENPPECKQQ